MNVDNRDDTGLHKQVLGKARISMGNFLKAVVFGYDNQVRKYALPIIVCFGLAGILIDLDHYLINTMQRIRPLHLEYFICMWLIGICFITYADRCLHNNSMKE